MKSAAVWYKNAYRRSVIDVPITADDEGFMTEIDLQDYVYLLVQGRVQLMVRSVRLSVSLWLPNSTMALERHIEPDGLCFTAKTPFRRVFCNCIPSDYEKSQARRSAIIIR